MDAAAPADPNPKEVAVGLVEAADSVDAVVGPTLVAVGRTPEVVADPTPLRSSAAVAAPSRLASAGSSAPLAVVAPVVVAVASEAHCLLKATTSIQISTWA